VELPVIPSPDPSARTLEINYTLDRTKDLLIAFDIKPKTVITDNWGNVRAIGTAAVPFTGAPHYFKTATQLAASNVRPGLIQGAFDRLYLVEKIEVL